ncbi:Hypothetical Protein FCC1311_000932 [Hondaea fermentalgiana]|uniref:Uncharacterized protein n=1 Tax=Hondaea fermentalgiana TaxID=2315210 RepID=A0A2R5G854_9STRA|nr:Hypothetical Protein FCC1311_000932 [Hondaea fermentalgiana]|eukprot:GBG23874.1 Hypothetical Protein FCC1311_000932 [Hondaea fermentalgiana]
MADGAMARNKPCFICFPAGRARIASHRIASHRISSHRMQVPVPVPVPVPETVVATAPATAANASPEERGELVLAPRGRLDLFGRALPARMTTVAGLLVSSIVGVIVGLVLVFLEDVIFVATGALRPEDGTTMMRRVFSSLPLLCAFIFAFDCLMGILVIKFPPDLELDLTSAEQPSLRIRMGGVLSIFHVSNFRSETTTVRIMRLSKLQSFFIGNFSMASDVEGGDAALYCVELRQKGWSCSSLCDSHTRFVLRDTNAFLEACRKLNIPVAGAEEHVIADNSILGSV